MKSVTPLSNDPSEPLCSGFQTYCYLALIVSFFALVLVKSIGWNGDFPLVLAFLRFFPPVLYAACGLLALSIPARLLYKYISMSKLYADSAFTLQRGSDAAVSQKDNAALPASAKSVKCLRKLFCTVRFLFDREEIQCLALAGITFLAIYIGCGENLLIFLLLFLMTFCADSRHIAAAIFFTHAFGILLAVNAYLSELARDDIYVFSYSICHSWGFFNPNLLGLNLFITVLFGWYLWGAAHRRMFTAIGILLSIACFFASGCRTAALSILILVLLSWLPGTRTRAVRYVITCLPLIMLAVSILLGILLFPLDEKSGSTFFTRFTECVYAFREHGLHLFVEDYSTSFRQYYFDNGYVNWVFRRGIIASAGFFLSLLFATRRLARCGNGRLIRMFICVLLYYFMEGHLDMFFVPFLALCPDSEQ